MPRIIDVPEAVSVETDAHLLGHQGGVLRRFKASDITGSVASVNGQTGDVVLTVSDISFDTMALPAIDIDTASSPYVFSHGNSDSFRVFRFNTVDGDVDIQIDSLPNDRPFMITNVGGGFDITLSSTKPELLGWSLVLLSTDWVMLNYPNGSDHVDVVASNRIELMGVSIPSGGSTGDILTKASAANGDAVWIAPTPSRSFSAHKNGTDQVGIVGVTKVTFPTEDWDIGGCYDAANSKYTPDVAGVYQFVISFSIVTPTAGFDYELKLYKNGNLEKQLRIDAATANTRHIPPLVCFAQANGTTDYFEAYAYFQDTKTLSGVTTNTYFQGALLK